MVDPDDRRPDRRTYVALAAVVAVGAIVVVGATAILRLRPPSAELVATTNLEALTEEAEQDGSARAQLVDFDDGYELRVAVSGVTAGDGFLELWLASSDVTRLISLGPVQDDGFYQLPPGFDPTEFPVVDVSVEPLDGNPAHSGDSLFRGELEL